jgi:hypothetical protein
MLVREGCSPEIFKDPDRFKYTGLIDRKRLNVPLQKARSAEGFVIKCRCRAS